MAAVSQQQTRRSSGTAPTTAHHHVGHLNEATLNSLRAICVASLITLLNWSCGAYAADSEVEGVLRSISRDINKSLPLQIDREKMLEVTVALHNTLIFKYKFTDETIINDPRFNKEKYLAYLRASLSQSTCKDSGTFELLRKGAKYNYLFINKRGLQIIDFSLDAKVCSDYLRK